MDTIKLTLPDDVMEAIGAEAKKMGVSADAVASVILCDEVTHTFCAKNKAKS